MPLRLAERGPHERPPERLLSLGPTALTVVELIAILLGTGTAQEDALAVAHRLLGMGGGSLRDLAMRPVGLLAGVSGIGLAKAARVSAALELGRRLSVESREAGRQVSSPADVRRWCGPMLRDLAVEEFHVLTLDAQNRI